MQLIEIINVLISRLDKAGVGPEFAPGFMKSFTTLYNADSQQSLGQINTRLQYLGWEDLDLDYHTMQLAVACYEADGLDALGRISSNRDIDNRRAA